MPPGRLHEPTQAHFGDETQPEQDTVVVTETAGQLLASYETPQKEYV